MHGTSILFECCAEEEEEEASEEDAPSSDSGAKRKRKKAAASKKKAAPSTRSTGRKGKVSSLNMAAGIKHLQLLPCHKSRRV